MYDIGLGPKWVGFVLLSKRLDENLLYCGTQGKIDTFSLISSYNPFIADRAGIYVRRKQVERLLYS